MKSILSNSCCKKKEKPFPKLMIGRNNLSVVLFTAPRVGTVVHQGSGYAVGHYNTSWGTLFDDYEGDVCLTNSED